MNFCSSSGEAGSTLTDCEAFGAERVWADGAGPAVSPTDAWDEVFGAVGTAEEEAAGGSWAAQPTSETPIARADANSRVEFGADGQTFLANMIRLHSFGAF
jgi:hypothetical protein